MRTTIHALALAAALGTAASFSGCYTATAPLPGTVSYAYVLGALEADLDDPLDDVYRATVAAAAKLQLAVTDQAKDAFGAHVEIKEAQGGDIKIALLAKGPDVTHVAVRVGIVGDETKSRRIMKAIQDNL